MLRIGLLNKNIEKPKAFEKFFKTLYIPGRATEKTIRNNMFSLLPRKLPQVCHVIKKETIHRFVPVNSAKLSRTVFS